MTAEPAGHIPASRQAETVVTVPLGEYQRLRALERRASPQDLEDAEIDATLAAHREWVAAGRPGAMPHAEVRRMLLGLDTG